MEAEPARPSPSSAPATAATRAPRRRSDGPLFAPLWISAWGLLGAASALACALTVAGFLDGLTPALFFAPPFRVQYAVCLALAALVYALGRRPRRAGACAAFAVLNAALVAPLFLAPEPLGNDGPRVRCLVVNALASNPHRAPLLRLIERERPDLIALTEVTPELWRTLEPLREAAYPHHRAEPRPNPFGIALLSRLPLEDVELGHLGPRAHPWIRAVARAGDVPFEVVAAHPASPATPALARQSAEELAQLATALGPAEGHRVLLGDLNATPWSARFRALLEATGLRDSARGFGVQATFPVGLPPMRIPLDHALVSPEVEVLDRRLGPDVAADHLPLLVDLRLPR